MTHNWLGGVMRETQLVGRRNAGRFFLKDFTKLVSRRNV